MFTIFCSNTCVNWLAFFSTPQHPPHSRPFLLFALYSNQTIQSNVIPNVISPHSLLKTKSPAVSLMRHSVLMISYLLFSVSYGIN